MLPARCTSSVLSLSRGILKSESSSIIQSASSCFSTISGIHSLNRQSPTVRRFLSSAELQSHHTKSHQFYYCPRISSLSLIPQKCRMSTSTTPSPTSPSHCANPSTPAETRTSHLLTLLSTAPSHSTPPLSEHSQSSPPPQSPLYAILEISGRPLLVTPHDILILNRLSSPSSSSTSSPSIPKPKSNPLPPGTILNLNRVREIGSKDYTLRGNPYISPSYYNIEAIVLENPKGPKVTIVKTKRRKGYRVKRGHRQLLSVVRVRKIEVVVPEGNMEGKDEEMAKRVE